MTLLTQRRIARMNQRANHRLARRRYDRLVERNRRQAAVWDARARYFAEKADQRQQEHEQSEEPWWRRWFR